MRKQHLQRRTMAQAAASVWRMALVFLVSMVAYTLPPQRALAQSIKMTPTQRLALANLSTTLKVRSDRNTSVCETPETQVLALCALYLLFDGDNWYHRERWDVDGCWRMLDTWALGQAVRPNTSTGICHEEVQYTMPKNNTQEGFREVWDAQLTGTMKSLNVTLPDFCCWYGVRCCSLAQCRNKLDVPMTCNCSVGTVVSLAMENNNISGSLNGDDVVAGLPDVLLLLSCSLRLLSFQNNNLSGSIPNEITKLSSLWTLSLGYNQITGAIPEQIGNMTHLEVLEISNNRINGTVPRWLCGSPTDLQTFSPLTDILISSNELTGVLDVTKCGNAIMVDAAHNRFKGVRAALPFYPQLHVLLLEGNQCSDFKDLEFDLGRTRVMTEINIGRNGLNGTIPEWLGRQFFLTSLIVEKNALFGTFPSTLFNDLASLTNLDASDNLLRGPLPVGIGRASSLLRLDVSNNSLTGPLPESMVEFMAPRQSYMDVRGTYMSCCGKDFSHATKRYAAMDYSAPRLPRGIKFSNSMRPVGDQFSENATALSCPYLAVDFTELSHTLRDVLAPDNTWTLNNTTSLLLTWLLNPAYTLHENCVCAEGYTLINDTDQHTVYCTPNPRPEVSFWAEHYWIGILIAVFCVLLLCVALLWCMYSRGSRPVIVQNLLDLRKRLKGAPQSGRVTILTTDIEGFSDSMKEHPGLMAKALLIHNSLIRKALWTNFGYVLEQEGDSFSVVFSEAADAVKCCLQIQQMLAVQVWPMGLFSPKDTSAKASRASKCSKSPASTLRRSLVSKFTRMHATMTRKSQASIEDQGSVPRFIARPTPVTSEEGSAAAVHSQSNGTRTPISEVVSHPSPVRGLRVRIGVATGDVPPNMPIAASAIMEGAKVVSDAAAGGQILMCRETFDAVKDLGQELGCVDANGTDYSKLHAQNGLSRTWFFWRTKVQQQDDATLLHMGEYVYCPRGTKVPQVLTPQYLGLDGSPEPKTWHLAVGHGRERTHSMPDFTKLQPGSPMGQGQRHRRLGLYQVLAPSQVARGRFFGSRLSLKDEWAPLDVPYFSAPGALCAPLTSSDLVPSGVVLPAVTMVFCMADGGKQYASRHRKDARDVHAQLLALMRSVTRQVPGAYFVKGQDGDLKYMVAFSDPKVALSWCLAVQECAMYVEWPQSALQHWPEERDANDAVLFRGPRLKMGVCEGQPRTIQPDINARADYLGDSINMAARFMDAAAHGGQVVCQESLITQLLNGPSLQPMASIATPAPSAELGRRSLAEATQQLQGQSQLYSTSTVHGYSNLGPQGSGVGGASHTSVGMGGAGADAAAGHGLHGQAVGVPLRHLATCREDDDESQRSGRIPRMSANGTGASNRTGASNGTGLGASNHMGLGISSSAGLGTGASSRMGPGASSGTGTAATILTGHGISNGTGLGTRGFGRNSAPGYGPGSRPGSGTGLSSGLNADAPSRAPHSMRAGPHLHGPHGVNGAVGGLEAHERSPDSEPLSSGSGVRFSVTHLGARPNSPPSDSDDMMGIWSDVMAVRLGLFRFKGSDESMAMVHITQSALAGRMFPSDPPKGKGGRVAEASGVFATAQVCLLNIVRVYRARSSSLRRPSILGRSGPWSGILALPGSLRRALSRKSHTSVEGVVDLQMSHDLSEKV